MEAQQSELRALCSFPVLTIIKEYKLPLLSAEWQVFTCGFLLEPHHSLGRQILVTKANCGTPLPCLLSLQLLYLQGSWEEKGNWEGQRRPQPASLTGCGLDCLEQRGAGAGREFTVNCHWTKGFEGQIASGNLMTVPSLVGQLPALVQVNHWLRWNLQDISLGMQHCGVCHWV